MPFGLGLSSGAIVDLADIGGLTEPIPYPKSEFRDYAAYRDLANGSVRGFGFPMAAWHFAFLSPEQYAALATFKSGPSSVVYITTKRNNDTFDDFRALMIWPEDEPLRESTQKPDFVIRFRMLEAV